MWINRQLFDDMRANVTDAQVLVDSLTQELRSAEKVAAAHAASLDWMRLRLNQCEAERAALFAKVANVAVSVPAVHRVGESSPITADRGPEMPDTLEKLQAMFEDPGDDLAAKLGIHHNADGGVVYDRP